MLDIDRFDFAKLINRSSRLTSPVFFAETSGLECRAPLFKMGETNPLDHHRMNDRLVEKFSCKQLRNKIDYLLKQFSFSDFCLKIMEDYYGFSFSTCVKKIYESSLKTPVEDGKAICRLMTKDRFGNIALGILKRWLYIAVPVFAAYKWKDGISESSIYQKVFSIFTRKNQVQN